MIVGLVYESSFNVPQGEKKMIALESFVTSVHSSFAHSWLVINKLSSLVLYHHKCYRTLFFFNLQVREMSGGRVGDNVNRWSESKGNPHPDTVAMP